MAATILDVKFTLNPGDYGVGADQRVFRVPVGSNPILNGLYLHEFLGYAKNLSPTADNRVLVLLPPGDYDIGNSGLQLDTDYVDVKGFGSCRSIDGVVVQKPETYVHHGNGASYTVEVTAQDVRLEGLRIELDADGSAGGYPLRIDSATSASDSQFRDLYVENLVDSNAVGCWLSGTYLGIGGYWEHCHAEPTQSFLRCQEFSGIARHCSGGQYSFGSNVASGVTLSGEVYDCKGGNDSFGSAAAGDGIFSGYAERCEGGNNCFGYSAQDSGGVEGRFEGVARFCTAGNYSFGSGPTSKSISAFTGEAYDCEGGDNSFGAGSTPSDGSFSGRAERCVAGTDSFGGQSMSGIMLGCRFDEGGIRVSSGGRMIDCECLAATLAIEIGANGIVSGGRFRTTNTLAPFEVVATGAEIFGAAIEAGSGAGFCVYAAAAYSALITHCRMNLGIHANVTNYEASPYNVANANLYL